MLSVGLMSTVLSGCPTPAPTDPSNTTDSIGTNETSGGKATGAPVVGQPAPEVSGEFVVGDGPKTLADAKGQAVIVDFWGTFCEPCKKSFPKLQEMVDTQAGKLAVIAVSRDDADETKAEEIKKFAEDLRVSFPIVWDKDGKTAGVYNPPKMPTSYIIDKKGVLRFIHGGYTEAEAEELAKEIEDLVAE
jgi:peroxiredoxin